MTTLFAFQAKEGTGIDEKDLPPLNFKEGITTLIMLGLGTIACLGIALALIIELFGSSIARLKPGPAFQVVDGELRLALVPSGSIFGHPGGSSEDKTPIPIGPFPPGTVWTVGEYGTEGLPPGNEGSRLTLVEGRPTWQVSAVQQPFLYDRAFIDDNVSRGSYFTPEVLDGANTRFQVRALAQNIDIDEPRPVWFIEFTISLFIGTGSGTVGDAGTLAMRMLPILPSDYRLVNNAVYVTAATAIMSENVTDLSQVVPVLASGTFDRNTGILEWGVIGPSNLTTCYLSGRITLAVEVERDI
jgi:hypothetical protein